METKKDIFDYLKPRKKIVPDQSYFNQLVANVLETEKVKVVPLYRKPIFWLSSAAATIAIILLVNIETEIPNSVNPMIALNEISSEELFTYVNDNIEDFDTEMLTDIIPSDNIEEIDLVATDKIVVDEVSSETELNFDNIQEEDILEYILNEEIDIYDIEELEELEEIFI
jgi:hypothetical protein